MKIPVISLHSKTNHHHHHKKHPHKKTRHKRRHLRLSQYEENESKEALGIRSLGLMSSMGLSGPDPKVEIEKLEGQIAKLQKSSNMNTSKKKRLVRRAKRNLLMTIMAMNQMQSNFKAQYEAMTEKLAIMKNENPEEFS